jgi:hypothetical protein
MAALILFTASKSTGGFLESSAAICFDVMLSTPSDVALVEIEQSPLGGFVEEALCCNTARTGLFTLSTIFLSPIASLNDTKSVHFS